MFDFFNRNKKNKEEDNLDQNKKEQNLFSNFKNIISNTTQNLVSNVLNFVENKEEIDDFILDDMEELLIKADLGVNITSRLIDNLRKNNIIKPTEVKNYLYDEFSKILKKTSSNKLIFNQGKLNIYLVVGVNGAGKTTLIGKLANRFKEDGKKVLIAAADTFRAAAEEQLDVWAKRACVDILRKDGIDPAAVVFESIEKAKNENYDILIIDTAGRLQNKFNLMEELSKIKSVIDKKASEYLSESILVLDANTGQNGLNQADVFFKVANLTSVALTKLDGSAKGAIIFAIADQYNLPVKLIGVGEKISDLEDFNQEEFISALFDK